ncbi:MAG: glutamate--tRNA ligase [Nanoarchaeota archaeon]|nr:glutamate--tRNA ligase [Nanoarchaeota archaeon]
MKDFSREIWAYALRNAIDFGKVDAGKILPKLFQHGLDKKDIRKIMPEIQKIAGEVNKLSAGEREKEFEKYGEFVKEKEEKEEGLPELEEAVEGKVVTRLAPEPSKYNHIGHALVFLIQYLYAKKYKGKCILRFDDTNPEKSALEYYRSMKEDLAWLGIKWDMEILASNDMARMYKLAEKLINQGDAFVCSCAQEDMKELRDKMKACKCRKNSKEDNLGEWKLMLSGKFKEGDRILRLKGDMKSKNGVMRDPVIFRISYSSHFIQKDKYCVWPMYDFESSVKDSLDGITHVIRSKEFELRAELHANIVKLLGMKPPIIREIGRYQITGAETQGRVIREMIEKGEIKGWDDPRLVTVKALRRRGFVPEMFQELAQTVGLSKSSGRIDPTVLAATNRKIIDQRAARYSFIADPVELEITGTPAMKEIEVLLHPDKDEKRKVKIGHEFFISKEDFENLKGKEIRLLHLYNIKLGSKVVKGKVKCEFTSSDVKDIPKINWVSFGVKARVFMPDGKWVSGVVDEGVWDLKPGAIIQFERFGFVRFDGIHNHLYEFWFAHK